MKRVIFSLVLISSLASARPFGPGQTGATAFSPNASGGAGISTINSDNTSAQVITSGTSGTNISVATVGGTTTISIPDASASARGVIKSSGAQTLGVDLTLSGAAPIISALTASQVVATSGTKQLVSLAYASANTASALVQRDASGNFAGGTFTGAVAGNASTATALAANPTDCSAGQFASAIAANGNLTCADPFSGMVESIVGQIDTPEVRTYILDQSASFAYTVNSIIAQCASGTVDFDLEIDGTDITGCAAQQWTSAESTDTCTAANAVAVGNTLRINVTAVSSPDKCAYTAKYTR